MHHDDLGIQLGLAYAAFVDWLNAEMAAAGFDDLGARFGYLFRALADGPATLTDLADGLRMSTQGAAKILTEMQARGYVRRVAHPTDAAGPADRAHRSRPAGAGGRARSAPTLRTDAGRTDRGTCGVDAAPCARGHPRARRRRPGQSPAPSPLSGIAAGEQGSQREAIGLSLCRIRSARDRLGWRSSHSVARSAGSGRLTYQPWALSQPRSSSRSQTSSVSTPSATASMPSACARSTIERTILASSGDVRSAA